MRKLLKSFLHLVYPSLCLHCEILLENPDYLLCQDCLLLLKLIDHQERCPRCFSERYCPEQRICDECFKHSRRWALAKAAAAFDYAGPAATLIRKIKYGDQPYFTKGAAAYMVTQLIQLEWPLPEVIIPVPISLTHWLSRGYNQSLLLAEELSKLIERPVIEGLGRTSGDYSQAGLSRQQRLAFEGRSLYLKKGMELRDKTVLLIDDVMTTGSTLNRCAECLLEAFPSTIMALTFCRSSQ